VTNPRDDEAFDEIVESDLKALYEAEVPDLRFAPQRTVDAAHRWPRSLYGRWRPALASIGVVAAVAVALAATALRGGETHPVSAAEVFERASASAQSAAPSDDTPAYHMISTAGKLGTAKEFTTETWYGGAGRFHIEDSAPDGFLFGQVVNGEDVWIDQTLDGITRAAHGSSAGLGKGFNGEFLAGQQSLADVLAQYGGSCQSPEQIGEDTFLARSVYVIQVTADPDLCGSDEENVKTRAIAGSSLMLWVDQETFLTLKTEHREPDGTVAFSQAATEFTVSPQTPDSLFTYQPPEGTTVVEVTDLGQAKQAIIPLSEKPVDGTDPCPQARIPRLRSQTSADPERTLRKAPARLRPALSLPRRSLALAS
jgi:outer membrane lipoprotein-sorting protein